MNDLERFETFAPVFQSSPHKVPAQSSVDRIALEQLHNSIAQAIFWLEVAESWAKEYDSNREFFVDLRASLDLAKAAQITAGIKD